MAAKVDDRLPSYTDSDLRSDYDEEPAFKMKEAEKVVAVAVTTRCSRLTRPALIVVLIVLAVVCYLQWKQITAAIQTVIEFWVENPFNGFLLFLIVHLSCTMMKLPMVELVLASGYVGVKTFGPLVGVIVGVVEALVASIISSSVEFAIGRFFCLRRVTAWVQQSRKLSAVATLLQTNGFKVVVMIRLASLVPFGTANYLLAAMDVSFANYLFGSVGLLPSLIINDLAPDVCLGGTINSIADVANGRTGGGIISLSIIIASALLTLGISIYISIWTRRALGKLENQERRRSVTIRRNSQIQLLSLAQYNAMASAKNSGEDAAGDVRLAP